MAELIGALVEAIAGIITAIAEAMPAILELLAYVAMGAITIIAFAFSRHFRERKRREWKERPKRKSLDLGISAACLVALLVLGAWVLLPRVRPEPARPSPGLEEVENHNAFRLVISSRSGQKSNELKIAIKKGLFGRLFHRTSPAESGPAVEQGIPALDGAAAGSPTNQFQTNAPAKGSQ